VPNRYVREDILDSDRVDALSAEAEVFYRRLMSKADDYGRFHGDWRKLRAALYPLRVEKITEKFIERLLVEVNRVIDDRPLVHIYFHEGRRYLEITNFKQQIRSESKFPNPNLADNASDRRCTSSDNSCSQVRSDTDSDSISSSSSSSVLSSENTEIESTRARGDSGEALPETPVAINAQAPIEEALQRNSGKIHMEHPPPRRDIGKGQVKTRLKEILRHKHLSGAEAIGYLDELGERHSRWCGSDQWAKNGGEYAKGLNNWLAPTIERYEQEPAPQGQARASPNSRKATASREFDEWILDDLKAKGIMTNAR
jgi:hypothetical protein